ncbi:MAG TPA: hypothetical protein VK176_13900 [Phycisphaerales bacterium]|nr:hypothetical protein [Phycisphaerales bacterium]
MAAWWSSEVGMYVGAIGGSAVGLLGGVLGTMMGVLAPRGKAKGLVLGLHTGLVVLGVCTSITGIVALSIGQPYHVYYPLLLGGGILAIVLGSLLPVVRMRYRQAEQRKLDAGLFKQG